MASDAKRQTLVTKSFSYILRAAMYSAKFYYYVKNSKLLLFRPFQMAEMKESKECIGLLEEDHYQRLYLMKLVKKLETCRG